MVKLIDTFLNQPVKHKLTLMVMLITFASVVLACIAFIKYDIESTKQAMIDELMLVGDIIGKRTAPGMQFPGSENTEKAQENLYDLKSKMSVILACIYKHDGSVLVSYSQSGSAVCPQELPKVGSHIYDDYLVIHQDITTITGKVAGSIYIKSDMREINKHIAQIIIGTLILISGILLVAFFLTQQIQKIISMPVKNLTDTVQNIVQSHDYSTRAKISYKDEIGILADNFNNMVSKIQDRDQALKDANEHLEEKVKERTQELEHALKAKSNFLSNMSHEIRTPNHAVMNCSKYVELDFKEIIAKLEDCNSDTSKTELVKEALELAKGGLKSAMRIRDASTRQGNLLNDILDLSKMGEGKMEINAKVNDLKPLITKVISEHEGLYKKGEKDLQVVFNEPSINTTVMFDSERMTQVISNLLGNAIKYSEKGTITISLESTVLERDKGETPAISFSISDEGIGIPAGELESIFEKFTEGSHTKKQSGGTGIGLAICHEIITLHSGKVWAKNNKDTGSTFTFVIPREIITTKQEAA